MSFEKEHAAQQNAVAATRIAFKAMKRMLARAPLAERQVAFKVAHDWRECEQMIINTDYDIIRFKSYLSDAKAKPELTEEQREDKVACVKGFQETLDVLEARNSKAKSEIEAATKAMVALFGNVYDSAKKRQNAIMAAEAEATAALIKNG